MATNGCTSYDMIDIPSLVTAETCHQGHRRGIPHGGAGGAGHAPRHLALEPSCPAVAETQRGAVAMGFVGKTWEGRSCTLWLFNIAMENNPFIDGLPIKNGDFPWLC